MLEFLQGSRVWCKLNAKRASGNDQMMKCPIMNVDAFPIPHSITAIKFIAAAALLSMMSTGAASAQDAGGDAAALAKKLSNPMPR